MKKRIISWMLCIVMILTLCTPCVLAVEGIDGSITILSTKEKVTVGETIDVIFTVNAKTDPLGSINFTVNLPEGLEYVSHVVPVQMTDFMMSSYTPATGVFGCSVTATGKNGTFDVLKLTLKAKETNIGKNVIDVTVGTMSKVDGSTMMDFGTVDGIEITIESDVPTTYSAALVQTGLIGATAELSKTANIAANETVTVIITPESGKEFETAPVVAVEGATAGSVTKNGDKYTCEITAFTANATVTVTGEAITLVPAHTHTFSNEWNMNDTHHWHAATCEHTNEVKDKATHTASNWIVDEKATEKREGLQHKECIVCKHILVVEKIPVLDSGFNYDWYWELMMLYNQEFNITASATEGGTITPAGISKVKYDKNITYTITPNEGYVIADVLVDGKSVGAVSEYTIKCIKENHTISAIFVKTAWENPYTDVSSEAWYYEDIEFVSENGLMIGTGDNKFSPSAIVNRAMLITVLWRLEGSPVVDSPVDFYDVPADEWYTAAVNWAAANGIVNGYGDGIFGAMDDLTHEQITAILNRYAVYKKWSDNVSGRADDSYTNSKWAENNVLWAELNGMFDGIGSDISDLTEGADRGELAAYLRRFCERFMTE